jgi:hypothetical protein
MFKAPHQRSDQHCIGVGLGPKSCSRRPQCMWRDVGETDNRFGLDILCITGGADGANVRI